MMAATLADDIFKCNFVYETFLISIKISLNFVYKSPINNKLSLVQVMVWHCIGDKQLPKPKMVQFIDVYMRHLAPMR